MLRKALLYLALTTLTQCSKCKQDDPAPLAQLPPATQTGANTFGCLVNGQPYMPKGNTGTSNFSVTYDPTFRGGTLNISSYRIKDGRTTFITVESIQLTSSGIYSFTRPNGNCIALYSDVSNDPMQFPPPSICGIIPSDQDVAHRSGQLKLTRFDTQARIVSGTFDFKLLQAGCDTLKITQGRFDARF